MKKIAILIFMVCLMLSTICHAEYQIDKNRWVWVESTAESGFYYDKETIESTKYPSKTVTCWMMNYNIKNRLVAFFQKRFYYDNRTHRTLYVTIIDMDTLKQIASENPEDNPKGKYYPIVPSTTPEKFYNVLKKYVE